MTGQQDTAIKITGYRAAGLYLILFILLRFKSFGGKIAILDVNHRSRTTFHRFSRLLPLSVYPIGEMLEVCFVGVHPLQFRYCVFP